MKSNNNEIIEKNTGIENQKKKNINVILRRIIILNFYFFLFLISSPLTKNYQGIDIPGGSSNNEHNYSFVIFILLVLFFVLLILFFVTKKTEVKKYIKDLSIEVFGGFILYLVLSFVFK
jgi:Ca2+/Na+ antiporter